MKKSLLALLLTALAAFLLIFAGCVPTAGRSGSSSNASVAASRSDAGDPRERYVAGGGRTFLDTLNRGREVTLSANDLPTLEVVPAVGAVPDRGGTAANEPRFRIQILASSQIDMARREKVNAENVMKRPVFMASEQSLYKLYVGDFKTRAEAEAALPEIRKLGYKDAWVVSVKGMQ